jgi:hypothetical protein
MTDYLEDNAKNELKRADHLLYVSLKYTRTADVIKSIIKRLISSFEFVFEETLNYLKEKKKIKAIPVSKRAKVDAIHRYCKRLDIEEHLKLYTLLKEIDKADFGRREEFRKHVTLIAYLPTRGNFDVDVPKVTEFFKQTKEFVALMHQFMKK